jgi:coenzyme F420 hydrogenase subunit beta
MNIGSNRLSRKIHSVEDVAAWQLCCGCGACAYVDPDRIEMIDALEYGRRPRFRYGISDDSRTTDAMEVCPGIELTRPTPDSGLMSELSSVWGPVLGLWEGYAADPQIRFEGASGGIATALAVHAIEQRSYHGILHIAARNDVPYLNRTILSTSRQELLDAAGSRYAPASPCDGLQQIENATGPCVFIGKPCDVAAVKKAMALRPRLAEKIGLTIAFFCAGTPSLNGTFEMFKAMGIPDPASVVSLRYRGRGWPGNAVVTFRENGKIRTSELTYEQSWGDILQKYRQWRCYICPDHTGEFADIAVADAWHRPVAEHQPGRSVIIARTERGLAFLRRAIEQGCLQAEPVSPDILPASRPGQAEASGALWGRLAALRICTIPTPHYRGFGLFPSWLSRCSIGAKAKSILSTVKRVRVKALFKRRRIESYESKSSMGLSD